MPLDLSVAVVKGFNDTGAGFTSPTISPLNGGDPSMGLAGGSENGRGIVRGTIIDNDSLARTDRLSSHRVDCAGQMPGLISNGGNDDVGGHGSEVNTNCCELVQRDERGSNEAGEAGAGAGVRVDPRIHFRSRCAGASQS